MKLAISLILALVSASSKLEKIPGEEAIKQLEERKTNLGDLQTNFPIDMRFESVLTKKYQDMISQINLLDSKLNAIYQACESCGRIEMGESQTKMPDHTLWLDGRMIGKDDPILLEHIPRSRDDYRKRLWELNRKARDLAARLQVIEENLPKA